MHTDHILSNVIKTVCSPVESDGGIWVTSRVLENSPLFL